MPCRALAETFFFEYTDKTAKPLTYLPTLPTTRRDERADGPDYYYYVSPDDRLHSHLMTKDQTANTTPTIGGGRLCTLGSKDLQGDPAVLGN